MGQVSDKLRRLEGGYAHWCPGCEETHVIFDSWKFDGNLEAPTFTPSVKITGKRAVNKDGRWTGEWVRDANGNPLDLCCHYFLTGGVIQYLSDCTHALKNQRIVLPPLPAHLRDEESGQ